MPGRGPATKAHAKKTASRLFTDYAAAKPVGTASLPQAEIQERTTCYDTEKSRFRKQETNPQKSYTPCCLSLIHI